MKPTIVLEPLPTFTRYVPLCVLGYCLTRTQFLQPVWNEIEWDMKRLVHSPTEKLQDMLVSILAGNHSIYQINTRIRPDLTLAAAWNRLRFAEQSTVSDTLNALGREQIAEIREGSQQLFRHYSQTFQHDYRRQRLIIDLDPTGLLASPRAEGSRKGYLSGKVNRYGRQLARVSVPTYHENLYACLYPGNQQAATMLKPCIQTIQPFMGWSDEERQRVIIRSDAGLGTDENINWLLWLGYQVLMKGFSGMRAISYAKKVGEEEWLEDQLHKRWIVRAKDPPRFGKKIQVFVLRWQSKKGFRYGTLLSTLYDLDPLATFCAHDGRGAMESGIKDDKQGLDLPKRRKYSFTAQEGLALLTDLAHNLLSWTHHWVLEDSPFDDFGTQRMVDELMCIPGRIEIMDNKLQKVALLETHPFADSMRLALSKLLEKFDYP